MLSKHQLILNSTIACKTIRNQFEYFRQKCSRKSKSKENIVFAIIKCKRKPSNLFITIESYTNRQHAYKTESYQIFPSLSMSYFFFYMYYKNKTIHRMISQRTSRRHNQASINFHQRNRKHPKKSQIPKPKSSLSLSSSSSSVTFNKTRQSINNHSSKTNTFTLITTQNTHIHKFS